MTITAKFASTCPCCNQPIRVGSPVEWTKGSKARHVSCAAKPGAVSAPSSAARSQAATERTYKRRYGWSGSRSDSSYYSSGMYDEES